MYKTLGILQFEDIHKFFILKFIHLCLYENTSLFDSYFLHLLPSHSYSTRDTKINLPSVRLDIEKQATIFQCCNLINNIDNRFLLPQSKFTLKNQFKNYCLASYE